MHCQLARVVENERNPERIGWYVWVEASAPTIQTAITYGTRVKLDPALRYSTPYRSPHFKGPNVIRSCAVELLPIFAEVDALPFEDWLEQGGEVILDIQSYYTENKQ